MSLSCMSVPVYMYACAGVYVCVRARVITMTDHAAVC